VAEARKSSKRVMRGGRWGGIIGGVGLVRTDNGGTP
jgi:hypothetical protein